MHILVLQHLAVEHPGVFRDFMRADGFTWHTVELDEGERIPSLEGFDAMMVMGGPQDVWQTQEFPWLIEEIEAIRTFVMDLRKPFLGICLGHQLLAAALGGKVELADRGEVGVLDVELTPAGRKDPLFAGLSDVFPVLQWHGAEVRSVPPGVQVMAASPVCAIQAIGYQSRAYGVQFHLEATPTTVQDWAAIESYARGLDKAMGQGAMARLDREVAQRMSQFEASARIIYNNFKRTASAAA